MVICVIAMFVFAVLGIFSAKYRSYATEAFSCVFNRITLRPCESGFDQKMKMKVVTRTFKFSSGLGKFTYKHFETISWIFTILLISSLLYTSYSVYNLIAFGTCDPSDPTSCIITGPIQSEEIVCPPEESPGFDVFSILNNWVS
ncbi:MAG: hypothetical protein GOV02_04270 [Candidatus Aenigmarchaeota archaeon]|nr:hypothetical protein [Candidatus Aenigmarchaeota archaeon]